MIFSGALDNGQPLHRRRAELFCTAQIRELTSDGSVAGYQDGTSSLEHLFNLDRVMN
jgi:hypothetical protein